MQRAVYVCICMLQCIGNIAMQKLHAFITLHRLDCIYSYTHIQYPLALTELGMHLENEF